MVYFECHFHSGIANAVDIDEQKKTMERLQAGKAFTLRDLYSQLQAVMNMGSMSKMLSMLPGMGNMLDAQLCGGVYLYGLRRQ